MAQLLSSNTRSLARLDIERGLVYLLGRSRGFEIIEYRQHA